MANNITVRGAIPKNHEYALKFTTNGKEYGRFSISDSRNIAPKDSAPEFESQYWDVQVWGQAAKAASQLNPGDRVKLEGRVELGSYEHKTITHEDGKPYKVKTVTVVLTRADQIQIEVGKDADNRSQYADLTVSDESEW